MEPDEARRPAPPRRDPEYLLSEKFVRNTVRTALRLDEGRRGAYWRARRSFVTRCLHEAGMADDAIVPAVRDLHSRMRAEAAVQRLLHRVEAACIEADQVDDEASTEEADR